MQRSAFEIIGCIDIDLPGVEQQVDHFDAIMVAQVKERRLMVVIVDVHNDVFDLRKYLKPQWKSKSMHMYTNNFSI